MDDLSTSLWRHRGSSVIYDKDALGPLIEAGQLISLRQALGWMQGWPETPPGNGTTVLVGGLETCLEVLPTEEAEDFLRRPVRLFILEFQDRWDMRGLVFGFGASDRSFRVDPATDELLFIRPDGQLVHLSSALWGAGATVRPRRVVRDDPQKKQRVTMGYHVSRIS